MTPRTKLVVLAVAAAAAVSPTVRAQAPPSEEPAGRFGETIDVTVVDVQAVVTDAQGDRVTGLGPEDFRLLVDGREVPVAFFDEVRGGAVVAPAPAAEQGGRPGPTAGLAPGEAAPASYVVFVDDYFGIPRDRNLVLDRLADQLSTLGPRDQVAAVAFDGDRLDLLFSWTGDREEISRGLAEAKKRKGWKAMMEQRREQGSTGEVAGDEIAYRQAELTARQLTKVYQALMVTLEAFADAPGRRVGLILSGGWPFRVSPGGPGPSVRPDWAARGALERVAATANSVGFTLYPIDAPGSETGGGTSASEALSGFDPDDQRGLPRRRGGGLAQESRDGLSESGASLIDFPEAPIYAAATGEFEKEAALLTLAARTGGKAMINGGRLHALEEAAVDAGTYYWLGFEFDRRRDGDFHTIHLETTRPGLEVRARQGWVDLTRGVEAALVTQRAVMLGVDPSANGDGIAPRHDELAIDLGEARRAGRRKVDLPFAMTIPMDRIVLQRTPKGTLARLELRIVTMDDEGNRSDLTMIPLELPIDARTALLPAITFEAAVRLQREPHALVFTLTDKVGGGLLVGRRDWAP